jgi:curved DNA-binding protein CbpA
MPRPSFRGDPYAVLGVSVDASATAIKARWRRLAREHHPDLVGGDSDASVQATRRMARINAAYELLSEPQRREAWDRDHGRVSRGAASRGYASRSTGFDESAAGGAAGRREGAEPGGPPRPRPTRPVTGRVDASGVLRPRNAVTTPPGLHRTLPGHPPRGRTFSEREPLRASQPCGPVTRRRGARPAARPSLADAMAMPLEFGRFRGHTLGEVADFEPTYIDWIATTVSRDRDLVVAARVVRDELDRLGVVRRRRTPHPGFGLRREGVA